MIRHHREPGFISDFCQAFNKTLCQRQRATMAYRPQANGTVELVPTATRALKMYVRDLDQKGWDEYAERLTFVIYTADDRIRGDTTIFLVKWPQFQSEAPDGAIVTHEGGAIISNGIITVTGTGQRQIARNRASRHSEDVGSHQINVRSWVWLYLDRVRKGYAHKLAHLWRGPSRVAEKINEFTIKLEITGTGYRIFPVVQGSKLKLVNNFPDGPRVELTVNESDRLDFDEILLAEDSWVPALEVDRYEVERMSDWVGYEEPTWVDEADLNCGAILNAFLRERVNHNRFNVMQSHDEM
ncbi:reverse transcriptase [Phytophthora megakarya]|uniref:Reverse transcriptase n=1 Tax=Phytophthora megakarya TaxID=4795 RepID=A0A225VQ41_9STRA|nr:reverse transcriptase [Phytophthora megakarya]